MRRSGIAEDVEKALDGAQRDSTSQRAAGRLDPGLRGGRELVRGRRVSAFLISPSPRILTGRRLAREPRRGERLRRDVAPGLEPLEVAEVHDVVLDAEDVREAALGHAAGAAASGRPRSRACGGSRSATSGPCFPRPAVLPCPIPGRGRRACGSASRPRPGRRSCTSGGRRTRGTSRARPSSRGAGAFAGAFGAAAGRRWLPRLRGAFGAAAFFAARLFAAGAVAFRRLLLLDHDVLALRHFDEVPHLADHAPQ